LSLRSTPAYGSESVGPSPEPVDGWRCTVTQAITRYIENLPVPRGTTARAKLEAYLVAEIGDL
jgi:hypothetical protein